MKGRPVRGVISGIVFGIAMAMNLHMLRVWALTTTSVIVLVAGGVVLGLLLAKAAPFGGEFAVADGPAVEPLGAPTTSDPLAPPAPPEASTTE